MLSVVTVSDWLALLTPMAVAISIILQKYQSNKSNTKLELIHGLVNGNLTEAMRVAVTQSQRIADLTKDPKDAAAATASVKAYGDHIAAVAQSKGPTPNPDPVAPSIK